MFVRNCKYFTSLLSCDRSFPGLEKGKALIHFLFFKAISISMNAGGLVVVAVRNLNIQSMRENERTNIDIFHYESFFHIVIGKRCLGGYRIPPTIDNSSPYKPGLIFTMFTAITLINKSCFILVKIYVLDAVESLSSW